MNIRLASAFLAAIVILCTAGACAADVTTIASAKNAANNTPVAISGAVVSAAFADSFYIQDQVSRIGICVRYTGAIPSAQTLVYVAGNLLTNSNGELYINATTVTPQAGTGAVIPVGMACSPVGGATCGNQSGTGISGANNTGMLVKIWGTLTPVSSSRVLVSDGSGLAVPVVAPPGLTFNAYYPPYPFVTVTGVSSCEMVAGSVRPVIRLSSLSDLSTTTPPSPAPAVGREWLGGWTDTTATNLGNLLSDNKGFYGPSVLTGVTYTYATQPTDPGDNAPSPGKRLIDGAGSFDWTSCVGVNSNPIVVKFDFKRSCTFTEVDIAPFNNAKNYVKIETATGSLGPWTKVYERAKADAPGTYLERLQIQGTPPTGRYLRLTVGDSSSGTNYLCEVWVWGTGTVNGTYPEAIRPIYTAQAAGYYSIPGIDSTVFTLDKFNAWKSALGSYANQPAVWSEVSTWGTITVPKNMSDPTAPILPSATSVLSGKTRSLEMARNMTEQVALALTNTSLTNTTVTVALDDFKLNGVIASNISGSVRVMGAMPTTSTAGTALLNPLFSADNMLHPGLMTRYLTNGAYIGSFPSVTLTPGGSAVFWVSVVAKNATPGTYTATLSASVGSPVTITVNVYDITLPAPAPTWIHTWGTMTAAQAPFVRSDWTQRQVDYATGLGITVWGGWPTPGSATALAYAKNPAIIFNIGIGFADDTPTLQARIRSCVAQAQALGLSYDQWYVEIIDEPGVATAAAFGAYCQTIKDTDPNVHIYADPCTWGNSDLETYNAFGPFYNSLIDISVPQTFMISSSWTHSWPLWNAPRFIRADYNHATDGISEADAELLRGMAWGAFSRGWNGWGQYSLSAAWPYLPYSDPWTILDETGTTPWLDHMMAYPGPNGPVATRRAEGIRAGWEDYCLLTLMRQRGLTSQLNTILSNYANGTPMQTLRGQMINYLKPVQEPDLTYRDVLDESDFVDSLGGTGYHVPWYGAVHDNDMTGGESTWAGNYCFWPSLYLDGIDWGGMTQWSWTTAKSITEVSFYRVTPGWGWADPAKVMIDYQKPDGTWARVPGGPAGNWISAVWTNTSRWGDPTNRVFTVAVNVSAATAIRLYIGNAGSWAAVEEVEVMGRDAAV